MVSVTYTPTDDLDDEGSLLATSDGGNPQADLTGAGKTFEGFSTGWYVWDPGSSSIRPPTAATWWTTTATRTPTTTRTPACTA